MKRKRINKLLKFLFIRIITLTIVIFFKERIYYFLINFSSSEKAIEQLNINEFIKIKLSNNDLDLLKITNRVNDKNIFELFNFEKKQKNKNFDFNNYLDFNKNIIAINKINDSTFNIKRKLTTDIKSIIQNQTMILLPGDSIICDCLSLISNKLLVFENTVSAANKIDTVDTITFIYDDDTNENFEIKRNIISKVKIPNKKNKKSLKIVWKQTNTGSLIFKGIEENQPEKKSIFITLKSDKINKDIINYFNKENIFINFNTFPVSTEYKHNLKSLEALTIPINIGLSYDSEDIFKNKIKKLFNLINDNNNDFLRININHKLEEDNQIEYANSLINIKRNRSLRYIPEYVNQIIENTSSHFIRININSNSTKNYKLIEKIIKDINKSHNLLIISGNNFDFYNNHLISKQATILYLPGTDVQTTIAKLNQFNTQKSINHLEIMDNFLKVVLQKNDNIIEEEKLLSVNAEKQEFFIQNDKYYTTNKFNVPFNELKNFETLINNYRSKYRIKDFNFSFTKFKNSKIKLYSKDPIMRCFSNLNFTKHFFTFDEKFKYYLAELKLESEKIIDKWDVSCFVYNKNFFHDYKIEAIIDEKKLQGISLGVGEFLLYPSNENIQNNTLFLKNYENLSLLFSHEKPIVNSLIPNVEAIIWSHHYPHRMLHLNQSVASNEKL